MSKQLAYPLGNQVPPPSIHPKSNQLFIPQLWKAFFFSLIGIVTKLEWDFQCFSYKLEDLPTRLKPKSQLGPTAACIGLLQNFIKMLDEPIHSLDE